jgi:hypothetical protein
MKERDFGFWIFDFGLKPNRKGLEVFDFALGVCSGPQSKIQNPKSKI